MSKTPRALSGFPPLLGAAAFISELFYMDLICDMICGSLPLFICEKRPFCNFCGKLFSLPLGTDERPCALLLKLCWTGKDVQLLATDIARST
jgi:hypothetical protein